MSSIESLVPELRQTLQFLLNSTVCDLHTHKIADSIRFRDVHLGHIKASTGDKVYVLCGSFLPVKDGSKEEWISFATIKTSGYEIYLGANAMTYCQESAVNWDDKSDWSSLLQNELHAVDKRQ